MTGDGLQFSKNGLHFRMNSNFGLLFAFLAFFAWTFWPVVGPVMLLLPRSLPLAPPDALALICRRAIAA